MSKLHYISYIQNQTVLFPQRIDEDIAENDPVRILNHIVEHLDLTHVKNLYREKGRSPYHPKMMLKVILYAYMNNIYSCRKIERLLRRDIHFIWLAGSSKPDFITINRFRNRLKDEINHIFTQVVLMLCEYGLISLDVEYIDGSKIESKANKYTFVWRKTTEKNREKLLKKISALLEQIDENIAGESLLPENEADITPEMLSALSEMLNRSLASVPEPAGKESKAVLREKKKQIKELEKHKDKLEEYNRKLLTLGKRNSYSKTDKDATFMHMKEDAMRNGQTKPGYNLQTSTENQFITDFAFYPNPTDTLTMPSFLASFKERYGHFASTIIADSGYGSEENYRYMEEHDMEAYVKYNRFHIEHRMHYTPNPFSAEGMFYNKEKDFYVCPMGQHMERIGTRHGKTDSGYITESARYRARNCSGCPLRGQCFKAKGNRVIEVNHRLNAYKKKAAGLLTSEEGIRHRGRRCIEPEAVFGQIKNDMAYRRFRHFGKDKITMDFSFFAIAFNIKKLCKILLNGDYNNLQALIKRFFEWVLRLKLNSIAFLGYKQMKIAIWPLHKKVRLYSDLLLSRGYFDTPSCSVIYRLFLLQSQLLLDVSGYICAQGSADVRNTGSNIHDVNVITGLTDFLDYVQHFVCNGLHLLLRGFLESHLVVLVALLDALLQVSQLSLSALAYVVQKVGSFLLILGSLLLELVLHALQVLFILLLQVLQFCLCGLIFRHSLDDVSRVEMSELLCENCQRSQQKAY